MGVGREESCLWVSCHPPPQTNSFSVSYDILSYFDFISNMRSFIQKGGQLHEEAEVRHKTNAFGAQ